VIGCEPGSSANNQDALRGHPRQSARTPCPRELWLIKTHSEVIRGNQHVPHVRVDRGRGDVFAVGLLRTDHTEEGIELARLDAPHLMRETIRGRQRGHQSQSMDVIIT
jgi:hypothetical protein